jgi:hypothetical protein
MSDDRSYSAFEGPRQIATGALGPVLTKVKAHVDRGKAEQLLVLDDATGKPVDFDFRGTLEEVITRALPPPGPGRPKLGVTSREVSLLPRHWEWLEEQPNGVSAALRRVVEEARKRNPGEQRARMAREAAHRAMTSLGGDRPHYEEALRALYAKDRARFESLVRRWPADVRAHVERLAAPSFETEPT